MSDLLREELEEMFPDTDVDEWSKDADGDWQYPESCDEPGWLVWLDDSVISLEYGTIKFQADCDDGIAITARRLLKAVEGFDKVKDND